MTDSAVIAANGDLKHATPPADGVSNASSSPPTEEKSSIPFEERDYLCGENSVERNLSLLKAGLSDATRFACKRRRDAHEYVAQAV